MESERNARGPVCRLDVFDPTQKPRYDRLRRELAASVCERRELPDGWALRLAASADAFVAVAEWITLERLCCPFIHFGLEWKNGETWLVLTGESGVKELLAAAFVAAD